MRRCVWLLTLVLMVLAGTPSAEAGAEAEEAAAAAADVAARRASFTGCDPGTADRLAFIEHRLEGGQTYGWWWHRGFTTFYSLGVIVSSLQAGLEDDRGQRADATVSAVKALMGTARLLFFPPVARVGADPLADLPTATEDDCRARLGRAEALLRQGARESDTRYSLLRHAGNVIVNVAGGVIVAEGYDESDGWINMGVGITIGEIFLWSHPWHAKRALEDYEREFGNRLAYVPPVTWSIEPTFGGARLHVRF